MCVINASPLTVPAPAPAAPARSTSPNIRPAFYLAAMQGPVIQADDIAHFHVSALYMALPEGVLQSFLASSLLGHFLRLAIILWPPGRSPADSLAAE